MFVSISCLINVVYINRSCVLRNFEMNETETGYQRETTDVERKHYNRSIKITIL